MTSHSQHDVMTFELTTPYLFTVGHTGRGTRILFETIFWLMHMHKQSWTRIKILMIRVQSWNDFSWRSAVLVQCKLWLYLLSSRLHLNSDQAWMALLQWCLP